MTEGYITPFAPAHGTLGPSARAAVSREEIVVPGA